jgi:hypothetical protein
MAQEVKKYTPAQGWASLRKNWKGYRIAKIQNNQEDMLKYAERIRSLQDELGVSKAVFPALGLT